MPIHANTYSGGMDRDSSKNKYQPNSYYLMKNMRLTSFDELSNGVVSSVEGNTIAISCPIGYENDVIIGHCVIRNWLIVWSTSDTSTTGGRGSIWTCDLSLETPIWRRPNSTSALDINRPLYQSDQMYLSTQYPIFDETIGYYESDTVIKVYWTDNFNMIRYIDIMQTYDPTYDVSLLNILPDVKLVTPLIVNVGGGNLQVGKIQYAFQYYNIGGVETTFSPCTQLLHLTQSSEGLTGTNIRNYEGTAALDDSGNPSIAGKSVTIQLNDIDDDYDMVRVVSLLYRNINQDPEIHIVGEYELFDGMYVTDFGNYIKGTITLNAFRTLGNSELYCKTIAQKGNKAVIGNIIEKFFDVEFDARAYRFGPVQNTVPVSKPITINVTSIADIVTGECDPSKLVFEFATPIVAAAETSDSMGITATVTHLKIDYTETVTYNTNSIEWTKWISLGNITFTCTGNNRVDVSISDFQTFAEAQTDFDPTWAVSNIISFIDDLTIFGTYGDGSGSHNIYFGGEGTGSNIVFAGDTLSFRITKNVGDYFTDFDHFEAGMGAVLFTINYDYTKNYTYTYETTTSTDVLYSPRNLAVDPVNWKFWIDKQTPDPYISCLDPYDATKITTIHLDMNTVYWYLTAAGTHIFVYNSKENKEEEITTNANVPASIWPNSTYTMGGHEVDENHDCINPYNYDFLNPAGPQIDEVATYCLPTDYANSENQFKYQSDLTTLGGEGPHVKYEFITTEMIINDSTDTRYTQPQITTIEDLSSFDSFRNPLRETTVLGLKRDEVYRYGLVLTNTRGQDSFVKWIGDIKTPTVKEEPITKAGASIMFTMVNHNTHFSGGFPTITNVTGDLNGVGNETIHPSTYTHAVYTIRLTGSSGTANISYGGNVMLVTFNTDLATTASDFNVAHNLQFSWLGITLTSTISRYTSAYSLGIKFSVDTTGLYAQGVRGMRIVRVERTENDRTIYSQGIVSNMFFFNHNCSPAANSYDDDYNYMIVGYLRATVKKPTLGTHFIDANDYRREPKVVQFISPEISYFKNLTPGDTDYIKLQSKLNDRYAYLANAYNANYIDVQGVSENVTALGGITYPGDFYTNNWVSISRYLSTDELTTLSCHKINEGIIAGLVECGGAEVNKIQLNSTPNGYYILNRSVTYNGGGTLPHMEGPSGTCVVAVLDTDIPLGELLTSDEFELYLVDYKRPRFAPSQYGGLIYEARQQNTYIECGTYTEITNLSTIIDMNVYGGDTYIDFYDHIKTMWEADDNNGDGVYDVSDHERYFALTCFPCESYINLSLVHGGRFEQWYTNDYCYAMREDPGTYDPDATHDSLETPRPVLVQEDSAYAYNSVYSQQNKSKLYFAEPYNWEDVVHDETLVKISLEKYPREEVDSFMKFLSDNEKLLPTQFGSINDLFEFKNYMIVFMDHAFGSLSIDERALLPIQNNSILELGAGNNLQNFDFISNRSGTIHPQSVNYCGNGFLWYDAYNASMGYYNGETQDIGLVKGFSTVMKEHADRLRRPKTVGGDITYSYNPFMGGNVMVYENQKYKESLCAFVYSEFAVLEVVDPTYYQFRLDYSPGDYDNKTVVIDGIEYIAETITYTSSGTGHVTIMVDDNPTKLASMAQWIQWNTYQIYFKDISRVYSFSSIINAFMYEIDIMPTWLIEYNDQLFDVYGKFKIYKENTGNYVQFYGDYRNGEIEYIINPKQSLVCLFNNHEYAMESYRHSIYDTETINETWDSVRVSNDYQFAATSGYNCVFEIGTGLISRTDNTAHELNFGDEVIFSGSGIPVELTNDHIYHVIWVSATHFQVAYYDNQDTPMIFAAGGNGTYHELVIPLADDSGLKRRIRTWRLKDYRDMHGYTYGVFKPRMRDTYQRMKFKYMHGDNKRILMHDFYTYYTIPRETTGNNQ